MFFIYTLNNKMRRFTLFLNHGENVIELDDDLETEFNSTLTVKNASILWEHENIKKNYNDKIMYNSDTLILDPGYYTFDYLKSKLVGVNGKNKDIAIEKINHDSKCYISVPSGDTINLKKFGLLLGFPENQSISATTKSPNKVEMNSGLRFITIASNLVNRNTNFNVFGKRSRIIASLPITSTQNLNGTVTKFENLNSSVAINNGTHKRLSFVVGNNVNVNTQMSVLLELEING